MDDIQDHPSNEAQAFFISDRQNDRMTGTDGHAVIYMGDKHRDTGRMEEYMFAEVRTNTVDVKTAVVRVSMGCY